MSPTAPSDHVSQEKEQREQEIHMVHSINHVAENLVRAFLEAEGKLKQSSFSERLVQVVKYGSVVE